MTSDIRAQRMPDIDDRQREYSKRWRQKANGSRRTDAYLKEGSFHSRVFATREDRDAWVRDFNEAGRRNYEAIIGQRSEAFEEGVKLAFFNRLRKRIARQRLAEHLGVKKLTSDAIKSHADKAFKTSTDISDPRAWNKIRLLARNAGFDTMGRELARA